MLNPFISQKHKLPLPTLPTSPSPTLPTSPSPTSPTSPTLPLPSLHENYSDRFVYVSEYSDRIEPQLTQKYAKLKSFPRNQSHGMGSDREFELVRNQQYEFIKQMRDIPVIPQNSFETKEMICNHGTCKS